MNWELFFQKDEDIVKLTILRTDGVGMVLSIYLDELAKICVIARLVFGGTVVQQQSYTRTSLIVTPYQSSVNYSNKKRHIAFLFGQAFILYG